MSDIGAKRIREHKKYEEAVKELTLFDDVFMSKEFESLECCEEVLQTIMNDNTIKVAELCTQKIPGNLHGKSVWLDVFIIIGEDGKRYNIEVQRDKEGAVPERPRYHASIIDATQTIERNEDFSQLPGTVVIFITESDTFGDGYPVYLVSERLSALEYKHSGSKTHIKFAEEKMPYKDGRRIIFVNGAYKGDDPIGHLMHDFHCKSPDDMYNPILKKRASFLKTEPEGVKQMCEALRKVMADDLEEAKDEARTECIVGSVKALMENMNFSVDKALEMLNVPNDKKETIRGALAG